MQGVAQPPLLKSRLTSGEYFLPSISLTSFHRVGNRFLMDSVSITVAIVTSLNKITRAAEDILRLVAGT